VHWVDAAVSQHAVPPCCPTPGDLLLLQQQLLVLLFPLQVLDEVRLLLQPNARAVVAELDKLNVYGPGVFFKPHFDTPRSEGKPLQARATVC
jgi:hypothetical protein